MTKYYTNLFTELDPSDPLPEDEVIVAKKIVHRNGKITYQILCNLNGEFFRPFEKSYLNDSKSLSKQLLRKNEAFKFIPCNETSFESYLKYLKTRQISHLRQAERAV